MISFLSPEHIAKKKKTPLKELQCMNALITIIPLRRRCDRRARLKALGGKNYCSDCHDEVVRASEEVGPTATEVDSDSNDDTQVTIRKKRWNTIRFFAKTLADPSCLSSVDPLIKFLNL